MNYWLIPVLILGFALYVLGRRTAVRAGHSRLVLTLIVGIPVAVPGLLFAVYYFKVLGEPLWLYQFRSLPGSELAASGAGYLAGLLDGRFSQWEEYRKLAGNRLFAILLFFGLLGPYLKPLVHPPYWGQFHDHWSNGVCLQTSESSCGPACAATLLRLLGHPATEKELAQEAFTSRHGTENWYLARALRRRGVEAQFTLQTNLSQPWPCPAIAGVRLGKSGHFITILSRNGDQYAIGDPLGGRHVMSQAEWCQTYEFTGFFLTVTDLNKR